MNVVFFDIETQKTFDEVGGRQNAHLLGLAGAVTYSTATGAFRQYTEAQVADLVAELKAADLVVGFNLQGFDYKVLRAYDPCDNIPTLDMLDEIYRRLGFRVSLDNLAQATLGAGKSADGLQAVRWFREGRIQEMLDYCQHDVEITRQLYEYGRQFKHLKYRERSGRVQLVPVRW